MRSVKLIARDWVKSPLEDVLWFVTRKNDMNVKFKHSGDHIRAFCQEEDYIKFTEIARRFCLVCDHLTAC